jgi:hypothetical protein
VSTREKYLALIINTMKIVHYKNTLLGKYKFYFFMARFGILTKWRV